MTKTLRVLLIEDMAVPFLQDPRITSHFNIEIPTGADMSDPNRLYERPTDEECSRIHCFTKSGKIDLIILGNYLGNGLYRAAEIADSMRDHTIVLWNNYRPYAGLDKEYRALGFRRFGQRNKLPDLVCDMFGSRSDT